MVRCVTILRGFGMPPRYTGILSLKTAKRGITSFVARGRLLLRQNATMDRFFKALPFTKGKKKATSKAPVKNEEIEALMARRICPFSDCPRFMHQFAASGWSNLTM